MSPSKKHPKWLGRPPEASMQVERLTEDLKWIPDDGKPGLAFSGLSLRHFPIAWAAPCECWSTDYCPRTRAMDWTAKRFHGCANGGDMLRASRVKRLRPFPKKHLDAPGRPDPRTERVERLTDEGRWIVDDGKPGVAFIGLGVYGIQMMGSGDVHRPVVWAMPCACGSRVRCPARLARERAAERFSTGLVALPYVASRALVAPSEVLP